VEKQQQQQQQNEIIVKQKIIIKTHYLINKKEIKQNYICGSERWLLLLLQL
jgi:hypothetical protein